LSSQSGLFVLLRKFGLALNARAISFLEDETMSQFQGKRVTHQYTQHNVAPPEKVFPLLCPVLEATWVPGWQYRLIYSESGVAEMGCVFITPNEAGRETTWMVTEYDPASLRIGFAWVNPGLVAAQIRICLRRSSGAQTSAGHTTALIQYVFTGLSTEGNREVEGYDQKWFEHKMQGWEAAINHYLRTGKAIDTAAGE
jgi:hypothetical protein